MAGREQGASAASRRLHGAIESPPGASRSEFYMEVASSPSVQVELALPRPCTGAGRPHARQPLPPTAVDLPLSPTCTSTRWPCPARGASTLTLAAAGGNPTCTSMPFFTRSRALATGSTVSASSRTSSCSSRMQPAPSRHSSPAAGRQRPDRPDLHHHEPPAAAAGRITPALIDQQVESVRHGLFSMGSKFRNQLLS